VVKNKLEYVMARLNRLCSEGDDDDAVWDKNEHEHRVNLFEWVAEINSYPRLR
jgi:hypothetical protein